MAKVYDRVKEITLTTGTGTLTLRGAVTGYQEFGDIVPSGTQVHYVITFGTMWEVGIGTYTKSNNTLTRTVSSSSNSNGILNLPAGTKYVFIANTADIINGLQPASVQELAWLQGLTGPVQTQLDNKSDSNHTHSEFSNLAITLDGLTDVNTAGATNGQTLIFNGESWAPGTTSVVANLNDLSDVNTAGVVTGNALVYSGTEWKPQSIVTSVTDASTTTKGVVELATDTETTDGSSSTLAVTPSGVKAAIATVNPKLGVFYENEQSVTANYTITSNKNAMSAGPISIDSGVTVTIPSGSVWTIV